MSMVVYLSSQVRVVLLGGFEDYLGPIGELVLGKIDLAEAALANEPSEAVVADGSEIGGGELGEEGLIRVGKLSVRKRC